MTMNMIKDLNGITVKKLKEMIKDWPEVDKDGELTEVWLGNGQGLTNVCTSIWPLNVRENAGDILLNCQED
jgi:hypothetical protein